MIKRIVFWEPMLSPHKCDFFSALTAVAPSIEVVCCAESGVSADRRRMGWRVESDLPFRTIVAPSAALARTLAAEEPDSSLHVFSGVRHVPCIVEGLRSVRRAGARFAIQSEPRVREGWRGEARYLQSWLTEGWLRKDVDFVLAIGANGPPWFRSVGYRQERILPFAYFVDAPKVNQARTGASGHGAVPTVIGFVGRLVAMKGVFDLVDALALLGDGFTLRVAGVGPDEDRFRRYAAQQGVALESAGVIPMDAIGDFMNELDVLVLPSRSKDDGWGVVVSEALMCGTAAIATPCVGASVMLSDNRLGRVASARSAVGIAESVRVLVDSDALTPAARSTRRALACARLSADSGANYLLDILRWSECGGVRPQPFYERER